jgi:two-component system nitrate/nitrite response regulator NarL
MRVHLSPREAEVCRHLAAGFKNEEIAKRLVISPETVRVHIRNGVSRLGARTRAQAIALAVEQEMLDDNRVPGLR